MVVSERWGRDLAPPLSERGCGEEDRNLGAMGGASGADGGVEELGGGVSTRFGEGGCCPELEEPEGAARGMKVGTGGMSGTGPGAAKLGVQEEASSCRGVESPPPHTPPPPLLRAMGRVREGWGMSCTIGGIGELKPKAPRKPKPGPA
mmetsp:Transcript_67540/g.147050  ORF Transcript_67540/g.147050 Transcript_67540/m.147050 type:complete len:148 (-) Transcript_67540:8-451(-)